jgi:hypothetical protein
VTYLLHHALFGSTAFIQLAVSGTAGLLTYLVAAIPRADLRVWVAGIRSSKTPSAPVPG